MTKKRIIVGLTGASGVIYGVKFIEELRKLDYEVHLIVSESAKINLEIETDVLLDSLLKNVDFYYDNNDLTSKPASGSFIFDSMVIIPCSIKSLSAVANCRSDNLLIRAADVCLKEKRKLVLVVRETPLHKGHLKLLTEACDMGALILPPVPSFYHNPKTIDDIINHTIGKIFDYLKINHTLFKRWGD